MASNLPKLKFSSDSYALDNTPFVGMCPLCQLHNHRVSDCPAYKGAGAKGIGAAASNRVACICCKGIGHRPQNCWILKAWVQWLSGEDMDGPTFQRVSSAIGTQFCFACFKQHRTSQCQEERGRLRIAFEEFKKLNNSVQRHATRNSLWTDVCTHVGPNGWTEVDYNRRTFVRPQVTIKFTALMLTKPGAAALEEYWKGMEESLRRLEQKKEAGGSEGQFSNQWVDGDGNATGPYMWNGGASTSKATASRSWNRRPLRTKTLSKSPIRQKEEEKRVESEQKRSKPSEEKAPLLPLTKKSLPPPPSPFEYLSTSESENEI